MFAQEPRTGSCQSCTDSPKHVQRFATSALFLFFSHAHHARSVPLLLLHPLLSHKDIVICSRIAAVWLVTHRMVDFESYLLSFTSGLRSEYSNPPLRSSLAGTDDNRRATHQKYAPSMSLPSSGDLCHYDEGRMFDCDRRLGNVVRISLHASRCATTIRLVPHSRLASVEYRAAPTRWV